MAYNPFDDVIEQDPAYMNTGGGLQVDVMSDQGFKDFFKLGRDYLQSQGEDPFGGAYSVADIERIGRDISNAQPGQANVMAQQPVQEPQTTVPVPQFISEGEQIRDKQEKLQQIEDTVPGAFYQSMQPVYEQRQQEDFSQQKKMMGTAGEYAYDFFVPQETAERAKEKTEKNKQILEQLGFNLGQMNREQMAEAKAQGYDPLTIGESLSKIPDFLFGDQLKGFQKLAKGEPLEPGEGYALLTVPLDILDFAGIGLLGGAATAGTFKLIQRLKKKYFDEAGVPDIKGILDNQNYAFDPDVQEAKRIFGGPAQIPGLPIEQGGRGQTVMMDVADRPGGSPNIDKSEMTKSQKLSESNFGYLRNEVKEFLETKPVNPSAQDFLNFLNNKGFKLNLTTQAEGFVKSDRERKHLKAALKYLAPDLKLFPSTTKNWMFSASDILNKTDEPLYLDDLVEKVNQQTPDGKKRFTAVDVRQWLNTGNPENAGLTQEGLSKLITKEVDGKQVPITRLEAGQFEIVDDITRLIDEIERGVIPRNKGYNFGGYGISSELRGTKALDYYITKINKAYKAKANKKNPKMSLADNISKEQFEKLISLTQIKGVPTQKRDWFRDNYVPKGVKKDFEDELQLANTKLNEAYRTGLFGGPEDVEKLADDFGIQKVGSVTRDQFPKGALGDKEFARAKKEIRDANQPAILALSELVDLARVQDGALSQKQIDGYKKIWTETKRLSDFTKQAFIDTLENNPALKQQVLDQYENYFRKRIKRDIDKSDATKNLSEQEKLKLVEKKIAEKTEKDFIDAATKSFEGHVSHIFTVQDFRTKDLGLKGMGDVSNFVRPNYGVENLAVQKQAENVIDAAIKVLNRGIKKGLDPFDMSEASLKNKSHPRHAIAAILYYQKLLNRKGMGAYLRLPKSQLTPEVIKVINEALGMKRAGTIAKKKILKEVEGEDVLVDDGIADKFNDIFLGSEKPLTMEANQARFLELMDYYAKNPEEFKVNMNPKPSKKETDVEKILETPYFKFGMVNILTPNILDNTNFKKGGAVRMAIGGDPLTNLNQQQFSPDPAFEGPDYFQEAVDSGNLQAVNLLNLFKVFKKPKVMATPSNVKQVEQARDPMPQGVPGSQELQPLPAGKPDFFFKSYLLDQLNLPNAPKASTPQGWREFLIKGKKVPEAEMLDTGILQYLEDTEKFYPNKKITKQELEDLYDTSPLGNLEVRVKQISQPGFDEGQFVMDQGRPKHKGAGNARIDEQADDYFEVVVNVPTLPGQERAYVNSAHFSEPNVLGFTRVGTYKNSNNETVAVIQEMQTDMLTEVRKEQERLFAMINALKRRRAQLVDQAQNSPNPDYYKNELRLFDQKYPPAKLDALETDNLIQPFPNIVAKDLIPERTASLNSIQEQINKLMMANVEQYNDPAYKTMVFDLAQQQNKIFEDLSSMNRSANYEESLQNFKVPSTTDRDELNRIAYSDEYLPSDYQLRQVTSFPPIPFNKQADYVDLLLKSTIKAAKGKGIDKVAIMPADVGANPRWGKSSDEAKKKFQNLYDKVGVQQLKNIAKKYGGTLEIEKIVDPSKTTRGLTFLNKNPDGEFQILKQTETRKEISDADRDKYYDEEITRIASGVTEPGDVVITREIAPGQMMDYYVVEGRGDATDVGYRMIPLKDGESADDAMIKIVEYNPSEIDMYTISFDPSKLEEPMYLFKKKSGGTIDKDSLVSITDIYGEYGR